MIAIAIFLFFIISLKVFKDLYDYNIMISRIRKNCKRLKSSIKKNKYKVITCEPDHSLLKNIKLFKPDIIFNALHGQFGEDGYIQTIFLRKTCEGFL